MGEKILPKQWENICEQRHFSWLEIDPTKGQRQREWQLEMGQIGRAIV